PHSPSLAAYEPIPVGSVESTTPEIYGDFGADTVDWLLAEDSSQQAAAQQEMSPFDMLRAVFGEHSDSEMEKALEQAGYDLGLALSTLSEKKEREQQQQQQQQQQALGGGSGAVMIGKNMAPAPQYARPSTPRNGVVCRFYLSTGQCLRADCRF